jgi:hypothetical protein
VAIFVRWPIAAAVRGEVSLGPDGPDTPSLLPQNTTHPAGLPENLHETSKKAENRKISVINNFETAKYEHQQSHSVCR